MPDRRFIMRIYRGLAIMLLLFFITVILFVSSMFYYYVRMPLPKINGVTEVRGLDRPVTVIRDQWGVPHVFAQTERDLFFASGFVQAQDRLFQMDLARRAAQGRLAEWFGQRVIASDRMARIIGFQRQARKDLHYLPDDSRLALVAFAEGVNACVESRPRSFPLEYKAIGARPEPWRPDDSLAIALYMGWGLSEGFRVELLRLGLFEERGAEAMWAIMPPYDAIGPDIIPAATAAPARGARLAPDADFGAWARAPGWVERLAAIGAMDRALRGPLGPAASPLASNSWVVDGTLSKSGRPVLANDPHLALGLPSVWYEMHLAGGSYDVAGAAFPGSPMVVLGHTPTSAWAATTTMADVADVFVEELNPANPNQYRFRDGWKDFELEPEAIRVRRPETDSYDTVELTVKISHHGPVIDDLAGLPPSPRRALALAWTGLEVTDPIGATLAMAKAQDFSAFRAGAARMGCPVQNWLWADAGGTIAYVAAGLLPLRPKGTGAIPADGAGGYDWQGFLRIDQSPRLEVPTDHFIVTANNRVASPDQAPFTAGWEYAPPYRAARAVELLRAQSAEKLDAPAMAKLQADVVSLRARRLLPLFRSALEPHRAGDDRLERASRQLEGWDGTMAADLSAPLLFTEAYWRAFRLTYADEMSPALFKLFLELPSASNAFDRALEQGQSPLFDDRGTPAAEDRDAILHRAWLEAIDGLAAAQGPMMSEWSWGRAHRLRVQHPLAATPEIKAAANFFKINITPLPFPGDRETLNNGSYPVGEGYEFSFGSSLRHVVDLGDVERATMSYPGGQSGQPFSPRYADLFKGWVKVEGHPMPISRTEIAKVKLAELTLTPATTADAARIEEGDHAP